MDYSQPMRKFDRYLKAFDDQGGDPDDYFDLCRQLLGCTEVLPSAVKAILVDDEGMPDDISTYHEAAVSALTDHIINGQDPDTWREALMPVYEADMAYTVGAVSPEGFRAWLAAMVDEEDVIEALGE